MVTRKYVRTCGVISDCLISLRQLFKSKVVKKCIHTYATSFELIYKYHEYSLPDPDPSQLIRNPVGQGKESECYCFQPRKLLSNL